MIHVLYDKPVADKKTLAVIYRVKVGLERRPAAEAAGREALARWETTLAAGEVSEGLRKEERAAVSKLEVLLKVIRVFVFATGVPFFFCVLFWERRVLHAASTIAVGGAMPTAVCCEPYHIHT